MRVMVMSIADGWDLPDRLVAQGHTVVGWVRPRWDEDNPRKQGVGLHRLVDLVGRLRYRRTGGTKPQAQVPSIAAELDALSIPRITCPDCNAESFVRQVKELAVDLIIVAGYPTILRAPLLNAPSWGIINCHYSLLPAYRGPQPVFWAIRNGEARTGVSVHRMTEMIDEGTLLAQVAVPINPEDTTGSLIAKLSAEAAPLVAGVVAQIRLDQATGVASLVKEPSYFGSRQLEDLQIDWRRSSQEILNQLHAVNPWDGLQGSLNSIPVLVRRAQAMSCSHGHPEQIVSIRRSEVTVRTGDGALILTDFQMRPLHGKIGQWAAVMFLRLMQILSIPK